MADTILVSAALPSGGTGVFALPRSANGLVIRPYRTVDGGRAADIEMSNVAAPASALLGGNEDADAAIAATIERAIVAASCRRGRRHRGDGERDRRLHQDARAVRPAAVQVPGAGASPGRHEGARGRSARFLPVRHAQSRRTRRAIARARSPAPRPRSAAMRASSRRMRSRPTARSARPTNWRSAPMPSG